MIDSMLSRALSLSAAAAVVACLLAGCGGGGSSDATGSTETGATTTETTATVAKTVTITVENAVPVGGIQRATVAKGDEVTLVVHSDVADEIHLHGYNLMQDVAAGGTARITFVAKVPGRFEAELEQHGTQIADLTVRP